MARKESIKALRESRAGSRFKKIGLLGVKNERACRDSLDSVESHFRAKLANVKTNPIERSYRHLVGFVQDYRTVLPPLQQPSQFGFRSHLIFSQIRINFGKKFEHEIRNLLGVVVRCSSESAAV